MTPDHSDNAQARWHSGNFALEHAHVRQQLQAAPTLVAWWSAFLEHTPLWLRTAYDWYAPTPEQDAILAEAQKAMRAFIGVMVRCTVMEYDHATGRACVVFESEPVSQEDEEFYCSAPCWDAIAAGQAFVRIETVQKNEMTFRELSATMDGVLASIVQVCQVHCDMFGLKRMGEHQVAQVMALAEANHGTMPSPPRVDISQLDLGAAP